MHCQDVIILPNRGLPAAIGGTSKLNPCSTPFKENASKSTPKTHWQGSKSNSTVGRCQLSYLSYRKFGIFAAPPFKGEPGQGRRKKSAGGTAGAKRPQFFFQRAKKSNPHGAKRPSKHPHPANETAQPNRPEERNAHPQRHTPGQLNFKTNATKTRETTPPPPRPTRNRRASETSTHKGEAESNKHARKTRPRRRQRRSERNRKHTGGRTQRPDATTGKPHPATQPKEKTKTTAPRRGDEGNDEANQTTGEGAKRRRDQIHHPQTSNRGNHIRSERSERKRNYGRTSRHHPPQRATKRENAQRHTRKKSTRLEGRTRTAGAEKNDDAETRATGATPEHPTRETRAKSTTNRRAKRGTARSKTKPPEAPRARSGRNIYIPRERWPPTLTPFRRPGTPHHRQNPSFSIP